MTAQSDKLHPVVRTITNDKIETANRLQNLLKVLKEKGLDPDEVLFGKHEPDGLHSEG